MNYIKKIGYQYENPHLRLNYNEDSEPRESEASAEGWGTE